MRVTVALVGYVAVVGTVGSWLLRRWDRPRRRSPQTALALWLVLDASIVLSLLLAAAAPVLGAAPVGAGLGRLLSACVVSLTRAYGGGGDGATHLAVAVGGLSAVAGLLLLVLSGAVMAVRARRRHAQGVSLAGRYSADLGAWVLDHQEPLVYCLAGKERGIVVTTGALARLDSNQLAAVLAHERAHLRGHHAPMVTFTQGLRRSLGWIPAVQAAAEEVGTLVEFCADDAARRSTDGRTVATALLALTVGAVPNGALGATGAVTAERLTRLIQDGDKPRWSHGLTAGGVLVAVVAPLVIALGPAVLGFNADYCPTTGNLAAFSSHAGVGVHAYEVDVHHHVVHDDAGVPGERQV